MGLKFRVGIQEFIEPLIIEETPGEVAGQTPETTPSLPELDIKALPGMPLKDFERAGLCLKINSHVLGEEIYFVSDEKAIKAIPGYLLEGATCYTAKELQVIVDQKLQPGSLQLIHEAKKIFDNATIARGDKKR